MNCLSSIITRFPKKIQPWILSLNDDNIIHIMNNVNDIIEGGKFCTVETSSIIGLQGELQVEELLNKRYKVLNTSKKGKCGDFLIDIGCNILVEVKKYSKTVPSVEIEKFQRDIDGHSSIDGAIMISLSSKIVGKSKTIEISEHSTLNGKIPVIYLCLHGISTPEDLVYSCMDMFNCWNKCRTTIIDIPDKIEYIIDKINMSTDHLSNCRITISETQDIMNKQLNKIMQNVITSEVNIKEYICQFSNICIQENNSKNKSLNEHEIVDILEPDIKDILLLILGNNKIIINDNIIKCGNIVIKIGKNGNVLKVSMDVSNRLGGLPSITPIGPWSYTGKILTLQLKQNVQLIISLLLIG
jgi:hypothetical protein